MGESDGSSAPVLQKRKRLRLQNYDYTQGGAYFITVCVDNRIQLLGRMSGTEVVLNEVGTMVRRIWHNLPLYYPGLLMDEFVVMPDHMHGIVILVEPKYLDQQNGPAQSAAPTSQSKPIAIPVLMRRFKSYTTRCYSEIKARHPNSRLPGRIWQRSYYERVIRSERDYEEKREYINTNPYRRYLRLNPDG